MVYTIDTDKCKCVHSVDTMKTHQGSNSTLSVFHKSLVPYIAIHRFFLIHHMHLEYIIYFTTFLPLRFKSIISYPFRDIR